LKSHGFTFDNQYPFMAMRGGAGSQSGGDKQQVQGNRTYKEGKAKLYQIAEFNPFWVNCEMK